MSKSKVFFQIELAGKPLGKIVFKLFDDVVPKTAQNFRTLCQRNKPQGFGNSIFHRIISKFMAQGGDFTNQNGTGGRSIYGEKFADQNFIKVHDRPFLLSMANAGKNTNGSQFFITFVPCPWLDGKHVVFGEVVEGQQVVQNIQKLAATQNGKPKVPVRISSSGIQN